jgi:hypothetical protein
MNTVVPQKLYSVQGVIIATVIGSLAAGILLVVLNYLALGSQGLARKVGSLGAVIFLLLMGVTLAFPTQNLGVTLAATVVQALIAYGMVETLQGATIRYHASTEPGRMHSPFRAAAMGLLTALVIFSALVLMTMIFSSFGLIDLQDRRISS